MKEPKEIFLPIPTTLRLPAKLFANELVSVQPLEYNPSSLIKFIFIKQTRWQKFKHFINRMIRKVYKPKFDMKKFEQCMKDNKIPDSI